MDIPDWIDEEAWNAFTEMRTRKEKVSKGKVPWTEGAAKGILRNLRMLYAHGEDPNEVLWQSVTNGWSGVFEVKKKLVKPHQEWAPEPPEPPVSPERKAEVSEMLKKVRESLTRH